MKKTRAEDTFYKALSAPPRKVEKKYYSGPVRNYIFKAFYDLLDQDAILVQSIMAIC
jgi:hypothetical protein